MAHKSTPHLSPGQSTVDQRKVSNAILASIAGRRHCSPADIDPSQTLQQLGITSFTGILRELQMKLGVDQINFNGAKPKNTTVDGLITMIWKLNFAPQPARPRPV